MHHDSFEVYKKKKIFESDFKKYLGFQNSTQIMILEMMFYSVCVWVSYQMNKELHRDVFPKREWKFISDVDGEEYTIKEL